MLPKILIVDDSKTIRMQIRDMLPNGNFQVCEAKDGAEGYDLICQERPNLVLLDFFMPRMNGWEVLQKIQSQPELQTTPVVVMTGRKEEVLEKVPGLFRYFACIEKPFEQRTLMEAVRAAMAKAKTRQPGAVAPNPASTAEPVEPPISHEESQDMETLRNQVRLLQQQVQTLTEANTKLHSEMEAIKRQVSQVITFVRQKLH